MNKYNIETKGMIIMAIREEYCGTYYFYIDGCPMYAQTVERKY